MSETIERKRNRVSASQVLAVLGATIVCWVICAFAILTVGSIDNAFAALFVLIATPIYWLFMVSSWCVQLPLWFVPIAYVGTAAALMTFGWFGERKRWAVALVASCVAFHGAAWITAEVMAGAYVRFQKIRVPGEVRTYYQASAIGMMRAGTSANLRPAHAVITTSEGCYLWSFRENEFVKTETSGQCGRSR